MKIKERKEQINTSKTSRLCYRPACLPRVVAFCTFFYKVVGWTSINQYITKYVVALLQANRLLFMGRNQVPILTIPFRRWQPDLQRGRYIVFTKRNNLCCLSQSSSNRIFFFLTIYVLDFDRYSQVKLFVKLFILSTL